MLLPVFQSLFSLVLYVSISSCSHVHFEIDLTWETEAPDGNPRQMILTNRQFPGPALELDFGDEVEVWRVAGVASSLTKQL